MSYTYDYPRPAVATDCVVFGFNGRELQILLIERGNEPFKGCWAFPGGFMNMDETAEQGVSLPYWFWLMVFALPKEMPLTESPELYEVHLHQP